MALIEIKSGKYMVKIRKKGFPEISQTFETEEDANLFIKYKEDFFDQISSFEPSPKELITIGMAIDLKIQEQESKNASQKTIESIRLLKFIFSDVIDESIHDITEKRWLDIAMKLLSRKILSGKKDRTISFRTVFNRFNTLSTIFSYLISLNYIDVNPVHPIVQMLRNKEKTTPKSQLSSGSVFQDLEL